MKILLSMLVAVGFVVGIIIGGSLKGKENSDCYKFSLLQAVSQVDQGGYIADVQARQKAQDEALVPLLTTCLQ
ncbi:hypothetical protein HYV73_00265 [Candidatus Uhrbacteria bacterium]|nr:hypothetical protein [Candidatus Uhrbacteria bacterium]